MLKLLARLFTWDFWISDDPRLTEIDEELDQCRTN